MGSGGCSGIWIVSVVCLFDVPDATEADGATTVLAGFSVPLILSTVVIGKIIWFGLVVTMLRFAPGLLMRVPVMGVQVKIFPD